jgi:hypothetical protein
MNDDRAAERQRLITALLGPGEPELTCEECFEQLDHYVDLQLAGADGDRAVPGMRAHLRGCPACFDDHASLLEFLASDSALHASAPPPTTPTDPPTI